MVNRAYKAELPQLRKTLKKLRGFTLYMVRAVLNGKDDEILNLTKQIYSDEDMLT